MMPMLRRRKAREMEKVENLSRTATVEKSFPTHRNKSDHACASLWLLAAENGVSSLGERAISPDMLEWEIAGFLNQRDEPVLGFGQSFRHDHCV